MTNEVKIITVSLISMLLIGLFVAPLTKGGESSASFKELQPPKETIISPQFESGTGLGGILDVIMGSIATVTWFFGTIGGLILRGFSGGPILQILNFIFTVMIFIAIWKLMPTT
jgi:hypothetical protein